MGVVKANLIKYLCGVKKLIIILSILVPLFSWAQEIDSLHHNIELVEVTASLKHEDVLRTPIAATTISMQRLEEQNISSIKDISLISPNFYQPDYGSSITSSIYVRGFGSRIDQPTLGVVIDDVPVMNKNSYDFGFYDIRRIELLRGPQGTLYGRNTSGGVMNITTLSPLVWQGFRAMAEYHTATSYRASAAYYARPNEHLGVSVAAAFDHDGGFFRNTYTNEMCDDGNSASLRLRLQWLANSRWTLDNSLTIGYTNEGGYAYHHYDPTTNKYAPIAYNDPAGYERLTLSEGIVAKYEGTDIRISSVTSYQYLDDTMTLDQDFTTRSMFTMKQMQREHSITEDIVIRNAPNSSRWQWLCGIFGFAKWLDMSSPVTFKQDGINDLILSNINKGIHSQFPDNNMLFNCDELLIASDFHIPTYGVALYHQSNIKLGALRLTAGLRIDYEYTSMRYNSNATVPYRFDYTMPNFKDLYTEFSGVERQHFFEILPKISAEYNTSLGNIYATITRGYKAGGFNTQIFSDILQVKMMEDMMSEIGIYLDSAEGATSYDSAEATRYKPETSWNFEIGAHLRPATGLTLDAAIYLIEVFDQQVTILPSGSSTGRMMSNAARAHSYGVELSAAYRIKGFAINADYGFTRARFKEYNDGVADYAGKVLPYAPQNTLSVVASYTWYNLSKHINSISLQANYSGVGRIYWNEANTLSQPFYSLLGAQLIFDMGNIDLTLWGRNLTNTNYDTFYFKSVGEEFFSKGSPLHFGVRLNINL